jgi:hypothetical protein
MEQEKIDLIKKVIWAHKDTADVFRKLENAIGVGLIESEIYDAIFDPLNAVVDAVSVVVGDKWRWIHWYTANNKYGENKHPLKGRKIRSIEDLIWLIGEYGKGGNDGRI